MTTQADTREAVQAAVEWLTAKHKRHGEIEDKQAADLIEAQATALTELRAECERLRGELSQAQRHHVLAMESKHAAWELAIEQRDSAEARADEVERDAARLDYVLAQSVTLETDGDGQFRCVYAWTSPESFGPYATSERAAIDAAIEQDDHP